MIVSYTVGDERSCCESPGVVFVSPAQDAARSLKVRVAGILLRRAVFTRSFHVGPRKGSAALGRRRIPADVRLKRLDQLRSDLARLRLRGSTNAERPAVLAGLLGTGHKAATWSAVGNGLCLRHPGRPEAY